MGRVPSPTQAGEAWIGEYLAILRQQYPPNSDGKLTPSPSCHSTKGHQREPHSTPPTAGVGRDGLCWEMECRNPYFQAGSSVNGLREVYMFLRSE